MLAKDILISVISFYVDILIMGLKGVNLSIIALLVTLVLFALGLLFIWAYLGYLLLRGSFTDCF